MGVSLFTKTVKLFFYMHVCEKYIHVCTCIYIYIWLSRVLFCSQRSKYGNCERLTEFFNSLPKMGPAHSAVSGVLEKRSFTSQHETGPMIFTTPITQKLKYFCYACKCVWTHEAFLIAKTRNIEILLAAVSSGIKQTQRCRLPISYLPSHLMHQCNIHFVNWNIFTQAFSLKGTITTFYLEISLKKNQNLSSTFMALSGYLRIEQQM